MFCIIVFWFFQAHFLVLVVILPTIFTLQYPLAGLLFLVMSDLVLKGVRFSPHILQPRKIGGYSGRNTLIQTTTKLKVVWMKQNTIIILIVASLMNVVVNYRLYWHYGLSGNGISKIYWRVEFSLRGKRLFL